jgi:hypothetical protein
MSERKNTWTTVSMLEAAKAVEDGTHVLQIGEKTSDGYITVPQFPRETVFQIREKTKTITVTIPVPDRLVANAAGFGWHDCNLGYSTTEKLSAAREAFLAAIEDASK